MLLGIATNEWGAAIGEPLALRRDVVTVDVPGWIAGVPAHRPLGGFTPDGPPSDQSLTCQGLGREAQAVRDGAVAHRAVRKWLVEVQIDSLA